MKQVTLDIVAGRPRSLSRRISEGTATGNPIGGVPDHRHAQDPALCVPGATGSTQRLHFAATSATAESYDTGWDMDTNPPGLEGTVALTASAGATGSSDHSNDAVNLAAGWYMDEQYRFTVDATMAAILQAGGTLRLQMRCSSRYGVGISEVAQLNYLAVSARVLRSSVLVGQAVAVGDLVGTVKFPAQATKINRSLVGDFDAVPDTQVGDALIVEVGWRHVGPTSGGTGAGFRLTDEAASDLPEDDVETADLNPWIEFRASGGGAGSAPLPTVLPGEESHGTSTQATRCDHTHAHGLLADDGVHMHDADQIDGLDLSVSAELGAGVGAALTRYGQILTSSGSGSEANRIDSPSIFWDHERQRWGMVYTGYSDSGGSPNQASLHLAYSDDLITWTKYGSNPILSASGAGADAQGCAGGYIYYEDGTYHLFYIGLTATGYEGGTKSLCRASATDPQGSWTREGVVIAPGSGWYGTSIWHPSILKVGDTYYLFFNATGTVSATSTERIGYASATALDGTWTVNSTHVLGPTGTGSDWDGTLVGDPSLYRIGDYVYMAYYGKGTAGVGRDGIAWCHIDDFPGSWTRHAQNPVLNIGASGEFDAAHAHKPFIVSTPAGHFHFYTAIDGDEVFSFGLAIAGGQREPVITPEMVQAVGRWEPVVTDPGTGPELVFDGSGDIVVTFVRTS